jgi:hypothetical protein
VSYPLIGPEKLQVCHLIKLTLGEVKGTIIGQPRYQLNFMADIILNLQGLSLMLLYKELFSIYLI